MSFADFLIQTCTIQRNTPGAQDAHGQPTEAWVDLATGVKCRLEKKSGRELVAPSQALLGSFLGFMLATQDILARDRIVLDSKTYDVFSVDAVQNGSEVHHKELDMELVEG